MNKLLILFLAGLIAPFTQAQTALDHYNEASALYQEGDHMSAIKSYTQAISLDSNFAEAYMGRGSVYAALEKFKLAEDDLTASILIDPRVSDAFFNRAFVYMAQQKLDLALRDLNMYVVMNPEDINGYLARVDILIQQNEQVKTYQDFERIMKTAAQGPEQFVQRGRVKMLMQDTLGALADYDSALALDPAYMGAYQLRANLYYYRSQFYLAIQDLNIYLMAIEDDWTAYLLRGECYGLMKEYSLAIDDYDVVIALKPDYAEAYFDRGFFNLQMERFEASILDFKKAIAYGHRDARLIYYNKGIAEYRIGNKEQACTDWSNAAELAGNYLERYCN